MFELHPIIAILLNNDQDQAYILRYDRKSKNF